MESYLREMIPILKRKKVLTMSNAYVLKELDLQQISGGGAGECVTSIALVGGTIAAALTGPVGWGLVIAGAAAGGAVGWNCNPNK